jgi:hypothetical protein
MPYTPELERLRQLHLECTLITQKIEASVEYAREAGASWEQIGDQLDMTKQGAQQKFGKRT